MGRPPMPVGTYGKVQTRDLEDGRYEARTRFRDYDGTTRQVRASGPTRASAERNLKSSIRDRQGPAGRGLTGETKLAVLADAWLTAGNWSTGTRETYGSVVRNQVKPALGGLRIAEAKVAVIDRALTVIRDRHGASAAKSTKSVLSGMFALALRHEACQTNPIRDTMPISIERRRARALTPAETDDLCDRLRSSRLAVAHDLPDLVEWMLATGARIGEALALREDVNSEGKPVLDLAAGTWEVNATIKRITGQGLVIQRRTKSDAGWRVLAVPPFAVAMIARRRDELRLRAAQGIVFGSPASRSLRDPSNTEHSLRRVLDELGYNWARSHTFRKTVATRLEEAGRTPRQVADHLGHRNPSMTMDVYFGRNVVDADAARILDR